MYQLEEGGAYLAPPSSFFQSVFFSLVAVSTVQMVDFVEGDLKFTIELAMQLDYLNQRWRERPRGTLT